MNDYDLAIQLFSQRDSTGDFMAADITKKIPSGLFPLLGPLIGLSLVTFGLGTARSQPPPAIALAALPTAETESRRLTTPMAQLGVTQGNTVTVGNTTVPVPWQQRGDRIGIADLPLMTHLGVDLQNTPTAEMQPVLWFADRPTALPTWHDNGYRYLDVTAWAAQQGWQLVPTGDRLTLQAPTATVLTARRGRQAQGDRLVLEVDRPVLWSFDEDATAFTLTLQATGGAAFNPAVLTSGDGNVLQSLQVTPGGNQIVLRGTFEETARPRVWSLTNPPRVVIDINEADVVPRDIRWAPNLRWRQEYLTVGDRRFPVHQLWLNLDTATTLQPIWASPHQLPGITPLKTMAQTARAAAAINAGFFNRNNQLPLGAIRRDDQWISGPILNRGAIAWNSQGEFALSSLSLAYALTTSQGGSFTVNHINSGYVQAGIGLYTAAWGRTYTPITDGETLLVVNQNQVVQQVAGGSAGTGATPIPPQGYVLALRSFNSAAQAMPVGTTLALSPDLRPAAFANFPLAIGGGPILVREGQIIADARAEGFSDAFAAQAAPRSAIGVTPNGNIVLVAIHYSPGGRGPTLAEAAQIMRQLGAQNALNLDGGTSSSLYLGGTIINRHGSTVGQVHNGLGVLLAP
ncbi:MAG: phosphodiester glycosidase family protein [Cyanobacteria bacterium J06626_4]